MLMLALPTIGLLALRCVDALAPLFILLFNFFDLLTIGQWTWPTPDFFFWPTRRGVAMVAMVAMAAMAAMAA